MADQKDDNSATKLKELRKAFDPKVVGKIPKGGRMLDYVGHAAVTDRLLTVDPGWTWHPMGLTDTGLPALDDEGNLWIELTVLDVTRIGVGDGATMKEKIGDALRNAAMRFGVALDLWSKDELESTLEEPENKNVKPTKQAPQTTAQEVSDIMSEPVKSGMEITPKQIAFIKKNFADLGIEERDEMVAYCRRIIGRDIQSSTEMTKSEAKRVIDQQLGQIEEQEP